MLPNVGFRQARHRPSPQIPTWGIAVGQTQGLPGVLLWRDQGVAVIYSGSPESRATPAVILSPSERYALTGDLWLSDRPAQPPEAALRWAAHLWEKAGPESLSQLQGMFAFGVWDREQRDLWLVRDPVGTQTLYYTTVGATRVVAPRLRTLRPFHADELDPIALRDYLCCAFVPGERTLWRQVREVRPGTVRQLMAEVERPYWQITETIQGAEEPLAWHGARVRSHLEPVVQACLPAQEPVGVYLSGGLDSSGITALAARLHSHPVHTYSIHFGADLPNELEFSSLVARHCGTQHQVLEISAAQMWDRLPEAMAALDDPIGDPLTVPNLLVGELAHQQVRVILNGEGGDPCFGGPKNQPMLLNQIYDVAAVGPATTSDQVSAYLLSFQKCAADLPQLLRPEIWQAVQKDPSPFAATLEDAQMDYLNRLMLLNIRFKGADHILTKVSNLTRAAGVVGRSPLFDPRIVALSMEIPPGYKLSGANEKAVLKAAVADLLPEVIVQRPKSGMLVPVQYWFREVWRARAKDLLLGRRSAIAPYLNQALIRQWIDYEGDVWGRYGVKLWLLASLEYWLRANR